MIFFCYASYVRTIEKIDFYLLLHYYRQRVYWIPRVHCLSQHFCWRLYVRFSFVMLRMYALVKIDFCLLLNYYSQRVYWIPRVHPSHEEDAQTEWRPQERTRRVPRIRRDGAGKYRQQGYPRHHDKNVRSNSPMRGGWSALQFGIVARSHYFVWR